MRSTVGGEFSEGSDAGAFNGSLGQCRPWKSLSCISERCRYSVNMGTLYRAHAMCSYCVSLRSVREGDSG